jgi:PAS domain S-box-containing protein
MPYTASAMKAAALHDHIVRFYEKDDFLLGEVSAFLSEGLQAGQAVIVIATPQHRADLEQRLHTVLGRARVRYTALDAATMLSKFMVNDWPEERRFEEVLGNVIRQEGRNGLRPVRAFGEMVALLWADGKHEAAIRLEELWNDLSQTHSFSLFCGYPMKDFSREEDGSPFFRICKAHSQVRPAESFVETGSPEELYRQIALLQQKAAALEAEVAKRKNSEWEVRCREMELSDFLDNSIVGLHKVGADGRILWANKAELDMLGYGPDEYIGHNIAEFHVDCEVIEDIMDKLKRGEALYDYPIRLRHKDGSIKHALLHSNALVVDDELIHTRCFTRDVTDRVRLETELQEKVEQLAETDRRKDEFLAMLGHELRNPLGAVTTSLELMHLRLDDPAYLKRPLAIAARQAALMSRLVDDLLDISRISRGTIVLKTEEVLLSVIVERAVELVRPLIEERSHRLTIDLPAEPVLLSGDAARLVQILANLLNNAAKYTDIGGSVELSAHRTETDLLLCVRDNGIGLTAELREKIFEPYVQGLGSSDRSRGGLGIGLTLVRNLVSLHGGSIEARSDGPERGSEFVVCLPLPVVVT